MARRTPAAPPKRPDFEFQVAGPAVSAQSNNRPRLRAWMTIVAASARAAWPSGTPPMSGDLAVMIDEFSAFPTRDRDNLGKPILDAMQGIVYENDRQVMSLRIAWRDINGAYVVRYMSPVVAAALSTGREFVWVRASIHVSAKDLER